MSFIIYQSWMLAAAVLCGILLGLMFDLYKFLSLRWKSKKVRLIVSDLLFWLIAFVVLFTFWYYFTPGGIRLLLILFLFIGFVLYKSYLSINFSLFLRKPNITAKKSQILPIINKKKPDVTEKKNPCTNYLDKCFYCAANISLKLSMKAQKKGEQLWQRFRQDDDSENNKD